jgi:hypothetical protein
MKETRERERKSPNGLYHGAVQLTNWGGRIIASTIPEFGKRIIVLVVTYPNQECEILKLTVGEFRSLAWIENLHIDAITYVTDDSERRHIVEAIQSQGLPELMDSDVFDSVYEEAADKLCDEQRARVDVCE